MLHGGKTASYPKDKRTGPGFPGCPNDPAVNNFFTFPSWVVKAFGFHCCQIIALAISGTTHASERGTTRIQGTPWARHLGACTAPGREQPQPRVPCGEGGTVTNRLGPQLKLLTEVSCFTMTPTSRATSCPNGESPGRVAADMQKT